MDRLFALLCSMAVAFGAPGAITPPAVPIPDETVVEVGASRVIAFPVEPADRDRRVEAAAEDPALLEVLRTPDVLSLNELGFIRVRGLAEGETVLRVGGRDISVRVVAARVETRDDVFAPRIIGPASGATVWGQFVVGVEARLDESRPDATFTVLVNAGDEIEASEHIVIGSHHVASFELEPGMAPAGEVRLTPIARYGDDGIQAGPPVTVTLIDPGDAVIAVEAEARFDFERPRRFADDRLMVGRDRAASGGAYFNNASSYPAVCMPVRISEPGRYQMMVRAAGSRAGGALPTVSLVIDGAQQATTNGRLLQQGWHRVAVGVPIELDAGLRVLTPYFANDFYVPGRADRNLRLDRVELVRVSGSSVARGADGASPMRAMTASPMAMMGGGSGSAYEAFGQAASPVRVAWMRPLDGEPVAGSLWVTGFSWAGDVDPRSGVSTAPMVSLLLNGEEIARQRSLAPSFRIDATAWRDGVNALQLRATLDSGESITAPVQRMPYDGAPAREHADAPAFHRFTMHDHGWDASLRQRLSNQRNPREGFAATFMSNGSATLELPDDVAGEFDISLELLGEHFRGAPIASVTIIGEDGAETEVGSAEAQTWWTLRPAGRVTLGAGPKRLRVTFTNDLYERGKGDRNLWLQSVVLREISGPGDAAAPVARVLYPSEGARMRLHDAVVFEATDDIGVTHADVLINDVETGLGIGMTDRTGRVVLPMPLRGLEPGEHMLTVRVRDARGNVGVSEPAPFTVLASEPDELTRYERAVHLLNRFAFGPDRRALGELLVMGERAWLDDQLRAALSDRGEVAALGPGLTRFAGGQNPYEVTRRVIDHSIRTPNPVRQRFVMWAQNHFSTWIRKTEADRKWTEHTRFAALGVAPFQDLLFASAESPAMLRYLDQDQSFAGRLNENYAREIMELHTMGVDGGYTQRDVTELASLLTGWTATGEGDGRGGGQYAREFTHRFDPALNDRSSAEILGVRFSSAELDDRYSRIRFAIEMLASHPSTARHVARCLAEHYVATPAPDRLVGDLAHVYLASGGDMGEMLRAMAEHREFWASADTNRMAQPMDYAIRLARTASWDHPWAIGDFLARSGAGVFDRATPDGYPEEDEAYSDSNAMIQRWRTAKTAEWSLAATVPGAWRYAREHNNDEWRQRIVDTMAMRLTGRVLGDRSNEAALAFLRSADGDAASLVLQSAPLIAQMPESNRR